MTKNLWFSFLLTFCAVLLMIIVSFAGGEFVAERDARTGQVVVFFSIVLGICMVLATDYLTKKFP